MRLRRTLIAVVAAAIALAATGTPAHAAARGSVRSFALNANQDGSTTRWNPCRAVHYRVNLKYAPKGAQADVTAAIRMLAKATGMTFTYDGTTTVIPQRNYGQGATPWSGKKIPPLVIAWARPPGGGAGTSDLLTGSTTLAGMGGWRSGMWSDGSGRHPWQIYTGYTVFSTRFNSLPGGFKDGAPGRGELILHELGHAVGLGHVTDRIQIMNPMLGAYGTYGAGDLAGLAKVGRKAGCLA